MEVFYLKINHAVHDTVRYLYSWIEVISIIPNSKTYILCDNQNLKDYVKRTINFDKLDYEFIESNRTSPEITYIVDNAIKPNWKNAAYAHLTTFLHARNMGYKDFWNIDADDIKFYILPQRVAELLYTVKNFANSNEIKLFSLDIHTTCMVGVHWSFGVVYTDNSVDWLNIMHEHCTDAYLFERYGRVRSKLNLDWFCTYLRTINAVNIKTFYVENLRIVHDNYAEGKVYFKPWGSLRYWKDGKLIFSVFETNNYRNEFGVFDIPNCLIKLDIGLTAEESIRELIRNMNIFGDDISFFECEHGLNPDVSVIFPLCKNESYTPPLRFCASA